MIVAEEHRFGSAHARLAARTWGDPANPPILALHGWLDNAGSFDALAPLLAQTCFVVALDLRGHGRSSHAAEGAWYHYVDYFDDVRAVYAHFAWSSATLLGHSLGGTLASLFAALYPDRVERLLLVEALGPLTAQAHDALVLLRRALDQRTSFRARRPLRVFPDIDAAIAARTASGAISADSARPIVRRGVIEVDGGLTWSSDPRLTLASPQRFTEAQVQSMLAGVRCVTVLVLAEPATAYLPISMIAARAGQIADIRISRLAGSHHVHLDDAAGVLKAFCDVTGQAGARRP